MLDDNPNENTSGSDVGAGEVGSASTPPTVKRTTRKASTRRVAPATAAASTSAAETPTAAPTAEAIPAPVETPVETPTPPAVKKTTRTRSIATRKSAPASPAVDNESASQASPTDEASAAVVDATTKAPAKKTAAKKTAAKKAPAKKAAAKKATTKKAVAEPVGQVPTDSTVAPEAAAAQASVSPVVPLFQAPEVTTTRRTRSTTKKATAVPAEVEVGADATADDATAETADSAAEASEPAVKTTTRKRTAAKRTTKKVAASETLEAPDEDAPVDEGTNDSGSDSGSGSDSDSGSDSENDDDNENENGSGTARRRRRRGGRRRRKSGDGPSDGSSDNDDDDSEDDSEESAGNGNDQEQNGEQGDGTSRRRRRRRRAGEEGSDEGDDAPNTVTRVRSRRTAEDQITAVSGSTRLEAKKQRRKEGREAGRRRAPIVSEAEFLARRESVDRVMVIRQRKELTQIAVLEDKVLVEHYVARESQTSLIGNVYLARVQNVLPSMEAAFLDIGKGRNAVLYAGEVNWAALGHKDGQPRKIESVLSSGQSVLVQVTKDPVGHKGARLTSQISLAGRFLVYVPDGTTSGISRKLPDTERNRLKALLKEIVPETAGVIVRTAAEGASEEELTRDVERLKARWEDIEAKAKGSAPQMLYGEPDLTLKVVRDLFTEDFTKLVIEGQDAWDTVQGYVSHVAPDLEPRLERFESENGKDIFATYRIEEQIHKGLDRKVWLPSGGSLIIDRTEAMTVVDVNTGKFTGSGGNLEETVTKNNLEAAEEIVRQLRLRDIGGIIVVDFIDMVLESNRDLVVRRLVECLGRDRTRHQVAEVTSLGLVQMTRKRIGTGLLEAFSTDCEHCQGRGVVITNEPVEPASGDDNERRTSGRRNSRGRGRGDGADGGSDSGSGRGNRSSGSNDGAAPSPKDVAAMPRVEQPVELDAAAKSDEVAHTQSQTDTPAESGPAVKKTTRRSGRGARTASTSAPESTESTESTETPKAPEVAVTPEAPRVTRATRTPRTRASEPTSTPELPSTAAVEAPVEAAPVAAEPAPSEPESPRVETRTRRRAAATRVVGPTADPAEPAPADLESGSDVEDDAASDPSNVEHVPIKKKGTRKR